ncbi:MAG TPA: hypothetical protein VM451_03840 [Candidatus Limnocylindria bacterium]|nr:hypothetical protein [Candidatus Limnocylindria bacterium]
MRFQNAAQDGRAIVYAGIQADPLVARAASLLADAGYPERVLARAAMNGQTLDPGAWRTMFPTLFGPDADDGARARAEAVLAVSLEVAGRGEEARSQFRGAIVEALTERLLGQRVPATAVQRERRILFDGVPTEIHPYDVTVEVPGAAEAYDCKWGARGIGADVLNQLDDARRHAADEGEHLVAVIVIFDAARTCQTRLARQTAPRNGLRMVTLETLDRMAGVSRVT